MREGDALETIASLDGPFDLVFIDANKDGYVDYYEAVLPKLAPRGLIVADNTLGHERMEGIARFNEHVADDDRDGAGPPDRAGRRYAHPTCLTPSQRSSSRPSPRSASAGR